MSPLRKILPAFFLCGLVTVAGIPAALCAAEKDSVAQTAAVYYCPMHPQVVSDKPGECPICHMRLVRSGFEDEHSEHAAASPAVASDPASVCLLHDCPMEKAGKPCPMLVVGKKGETVECPVCREKIKMRDELIPSRVPAGYASVLISPQKQQLIGIRTAPVRETELVRSLQVPARVAHDLELYEAQIEYLKEYRISRGTLRNRELAFKNLYDSRWEAPRIEQVKSKLILMGMDEDSLSELVENAKADESLLYAKHGERIWVYADVFESDVVHLKKGDRVWLEASSLPGKRLEARIEGISSMVDPATRRVRVRIPVINEGGLLRHEMLLNATIESPAGKGLGVPDEAVFFTGAHAIVFVDKGRGLFEPREVQMGIRAGSDYQILNGLAPGENVVVNGNFLLDSESKLKASIEQAAAAHAGHRGGHG